MTREQFELLAQIREMLGIEFTGDRSNNNEVNDFINRWVEKLNEAIGEYYDGVCKYITK